MQGDKVLHNDKFVSKYSPWKRIIKKGTGPVGSAAAPRRRCSRRPRTAVSGSRGPPGLTGDPPAPADLPPPPVSTG